MKTDEYGKKLDPEDAPPEWQPTCGYLAHPHNPHDPGGRCAFPMTHEGPHSWAIADSAFHETARAEFQDRVDLGGIERNPTVDPYVPEIPLRLDPPTFPRAEEQSGGGPRQFGRRPLPLPEVTAIPPEVRKMQEARNIVEAEMSGLNPVLTELGASAPGDVRRVGHSPIRAYGGRFERLTSKGWEPISVPIPPEGYEAQWNEAKLTWEYRKLPADRIQGVEVPRFHSLKHDDEVATLQAQGQVHDHYKEHPSGVEAITIIEHMPFNIGTAMKYLWRFEHKGGSVDLQKAVWYITREIERRGTRGKGR